jgi:AcrR family transcriptional regulator
VFENNSGPEERIIAACADFIVSNRCASIKISELARAANVSNATLYYHFQSKSRLIARAQVHNYIAITEKLHNRLTDAERSIENQDVDAFWSAVSDSMSLAWSSGQPEDRWAIVHMLLDISSDAMTFKSFSEYFDQSIDRWVSIMLLSQTSVHWPLAYQVGALTPVSRAACHFL